MSRADYRRLIFLDDSFIPPEAVTHVCDLKDLLSLHQQQDVPAKPARIMFHNGFCGSTLLAKSVARRGHCLTYSEPRALNCLATIHEHRRHYGIPETKMKEMVEMLLCLLSRTYSPAEQSVIKAPPHCIWMADALLATHSGSAGVVIYSDLETFLISVLKNPERRLWARKMLERAPGVGSLGNTRSLSDSQTAAGLWLCQMTFWRRYLRRTKRRIRSLDCSRLFKDPEITLRLVGSFFDLEAGEELIKVHAKVSGKSKHYDRSMRWVELQYHAQIFASEIEDGTAWARARGYEDILELPRSL